MIQREKYFPLTSIIKKTLVIIINSDNNQFYFCDIPKPYMENFLEMRRDTALNLYINQPPSNF